MNIFRKKEKMTVGLLIFIASIFLLTGCSSSGGSDGSSAPVTSEVGSIKGLNNALDSNVKGITFTSDINGNPEITSRTEDLQINLNGKTLKGNFKLEQRSNKTPWKLSFIGGGGITGNLFLDDPAVSVDVAKELKVQGETIIKNVARNSFNNKGKLNSVIIADTDGVTFNNDGIIDGEIEIKSSRTTFPIKITGKLDNNEITVSGRKAKINLTAKTSSVTLTVNGDNNTIYHSDKVTVKGNNSSNNIEKINNSISGRVSAAHNSSNIEVLLIDCDKNFADLDPKQADDTATLDSQNRYIFNNVDPKEKYYIFAYDDVNDNGVIDLDLLGKAPDVDGTDPLGFYGKYPKPVSVNKNQKVEDYNFKITRNAIGILINSNGQSEIKVELYNKSNKRPLVTADNLLKTRDSYLAFFTGLDSGSYHWKVKAKDYQGVPSSSVELGGKNNIINDEVTLKN